MADMEFDLEPEPDRSGQKPSRRFTWPQIQLLVSLAAGRTTVAVFLMVSLLVGFLEAGVILIVVAVAAALAGGLDLVSLSAGPVHVSLGIVQGLGVGLALLALMMASAITAIRLSSSMAARLLEGVRGRLLGGVMAASWERQSMIVDARFHELISVHSWRIANTAAVLASFTTSVLAFTALVVAVLLIRPLAALTLLATGLVLAVAFFPLMRSVRRRSRRTLGAHRRYVEHVASVFTVLPELRVFGVGSSAARAVRADSSAAANEYRRLVFRSRLVPAFYLGAIIGLLLLGLAIANTLGSFDLTLVGALVLFLLRGLRYSQQAQNSWQTAVEQIPYIEDVHDALERMRHSRHVVGRRRLEHARELELRDVGYRYPTGDVGVEGVTLTIHHGEIVGLEGSSGAGKSTIAQIILGLRRPTDGTYLVDGIPAGEFDEASWFTRFAYVSQEPLLIDGDIEANVRFFRDDLPREAVEDALERAAMNRDLADWRYGSARQVGSRGRELSGGQRQRIAIARALAGTPDVLVMDEPTSALDPESEQLIRSTLDRLRGEVTVILIAHRTSTLEVCDRVITLERGHVRERSRVDMTDV